MDRKLRILQVTPRYPPHTGGVETHVRQISEELVSRGHEVTVVTADAGEDVTSRERRNGVRVRRCRGVAPGGAFHVAPGIVRTVARLHERADVVHAHNYHSFPLFFAALAEARGNRPLVATTHYHGSSADEFRDRLLSLYRPIGGWAVRRADRVVAVSDWERRQLWTDFRVDATVIPNGLDAARFRDAGTGAETERGGEHAERDRPYLLCVGRLESYKGVQYAVRALTALPEYDLLVAGSGPARDDLETLARRLGVDDRVEFLGYVADADLPGLYADATAYVTLSSHESYGMTVAEALASGTPCVVREAGALIDWTTREDCVGVGYLGAESVATAVKRASELSAPSTPLPTWTDVVDRVEAQYAGLLTRGAEETV